MASHIHLIVGRKGTSELSEVARALQSYTSRRTRKEIENNVLESRKEWIMWMIKRAGSHNSRNNDIKFWLQDSHPVELSSNE